MTSRRPVNRVTSRPLASARPPVPREQPSDEPQGRRFVLRAPEIPARSSWFAALACLVVTVLLAGFAALAAQRPGVEDSNAAFIDSEATEEVRAAAEHALRTIYGYDLKQIDGYEQAVRQVVTGKMLSDLDNFGGTTIDAIKQAETSADAEADPIGVTLLDGDRAELLVNLVISANKGGQAQQSVAGPVVLQMTKIDGRWLAGDIIDR
ncbi:hypothetical protein [Nocardia sp. XZ_19_385]|uniref:hypothetical protein n=1 Tax=Nocardia sp. XZ_19_385 TaxID=2769488 RepID=UPI00188FDCF7|nr:hypothetical protein [Nocardia sp. XZ_19_385]